MANLADLIVHLGVDSDDLESGTESAAGVVERNLGKIGLASAAAGLGLEGFARGQAPLNESAQKLAASTGESSDAIRDLALEASNVTFPLDEVYASMESGRQQGLESGEQLQEFAQFWDMVGDASGESGPALAESALALRAVGIEAGNEGEALAALGFITRETTSSNQEFLDFLERTGPELREMGADVDDAAAIMGVLESEMGMSGRTARSEFRSAIAESDGTLDGMLDTLGVSGEQFEEYGAKVSASSGVIEENAAIHGESYTAMQKAQHWATELMHSHSGLFDVASALAMPLMMLGPALKGIMVAASLLGTGLGMLRTGIVAASTAIWAKITAAAAWATSMVVAGARVLASMVVTAAQVVARFAMMTAAAVASGIRIAVVWTAQIIASAAAGAAAFALSAARVVGGWVLMGLQSMLQAARMAAAWFIALGPVGWVIAAVVGLVALVIANWDKVSAFTSAAWSAVSGFISNAWSNIVSFISSGISSAVSFVVNGWTSVQTRTTAIFTAIVAYIAGIPGRILSGLAALAGLAGEAAAWFGSMKDAAVDKLVELISYVGEIPGRVVDTLGNLGSLLLSSGKSLIQGFIDGITSIDIGAAVSGVIQSVRDFFPFSPAKTGPLSGRGYTSYSGQALVRDFAGGMHDGESGVVAEAERIAAAAAVDMPDIGSPRMPGAVRTGGLSGGDSFGVGSGVTIEKVEVHGGDTTQVLNRMGDALFRRLREEGVPVGSW